ncbi:MAG: beta-phosphoglucomutase [Spirochaetes bacterium DG_61]|jgi:beta-phosphoglucomutase family hydrolase|nr:MAG: beta-phosphoglucomutase [Spirochaetes bacterium DG_61]
MGGIQCKAAIFDLDGVITQTAQVHFKAWKSTFDEYLRKKFKKTKRDFKPFTYEGDYLPYVDGKPRYMGVKSFLDSRDIVIPYGEPSDSTEKETICGIGNKKNETFRRVVTEEGVDIYQSTLSFIKELKDKGVKVGVASSSMNCRFILHKTGFIELFDAVIGGIISKEIGLKGKPHPDIFLLTAENLDARPNQCLLVEDAISGVEAGKNGNFGLVIGVARNGDTQELQARGADITVEDLSEVSFEDVDTWFKEGIYDDSWHLTYYGFEPREEKLRESLTTVGNGYFGTRGSFEMEKADEVIHYPGTYIAGIYNELPSLVFRKTIYNNDFVNCPNWLLIELKIGESDFVHPLQEEIIFYKHDLNMKDGVMIRSLTFKDKKGRITSIRSERIASMYNPHLGAVRYTITSHNYSEEITLRSTLDGTVVNYGVERYRELNSKHLYSISVVKENDGISLHVRTTTSKVNICMHARNTLYQDKEPINVKRKIVKDMGIISENMSFHAEKENSYVLEKLVGIYTSRDSDIEDDPEEVAKASSNDVGSFDEIFEKHRRVWHQLWEIADNRIEGDRFAQKVIHLHTYHLLVTASVPNKNIDAGIPARGLHGEAYRGHIFWDELFIFPFYNLHFPEIARSFLMYRYRRLDAGREYAKENGYKGAMYPWQSADSGKEETQTMHYNPISGKWGPDLSRLQRHVSIAIAYNIWEYFYVTNDLDFLHEYGAEMMVEIARFWASIAKYSRNDKRYHISGVMGPDEFHEKYPGAKKGGLKDNAYTNIMVCWLMHKTIETVEYLPEHVIRKLEEKIGFLKDELKKWKDIVKKMNVVITEDGIISQFDGYMNLEELDWDYYKERYGDIKRLDRILKSEGNLPDRYKVTKQADALMTYYVLSPGQVKHILKIMGYDVNNELELMEKNYEYYVRRTSNGSTLSNVVHAAILKYHHTHKRDMWEWFLNTLRSDIYDTQGGTTAEAIHCGVMGGTLDILFKSFAGINIFKDHLQIDPTLPAHWHTLAFKILLRNILLYIEITHQVIKVQYIEGTGEKASVQVGDKTYELSNHKPLEIPYQSC